ncbi:hypothetical protein GY45DRAFT_1334312 [Cubamyces sp. BRFM 1775]|nr:hypothetical protein GY45DRAFT_1334312 [Cubamyces sp. BRFM 1775]
MFTSQTIKSLPDLSLDISDASDWEAVLLRTIPHHVDVTAIATDPVSGLFAIGTAHGLIHVYGSPGVESRLKVTEPAGLKVKFLQFAVSSASTDVTTTPVDGYSLDEHDRLHVWDCASLGKPKLQRITGFGQPVQYGVPQPHYVLELIGCNLLARSSRPPLIPMSAFIALADGEIKTYDLLCLRISQYSIPNQWKLYERRSLASGLDLSSALGSDLIIDTVVHPRDLNLLFVLFEGGVLVSDLAAQNTVRAFELILPPGAPGGAGFHAKDVLLPRRLQATAIAIHPSGHLLAIGYADGTIGFWALEDEDRPLALRTLDSTGEEDLSAVDTAKLDSVLTSPQAHPIEPPREPIFKLAWSGFPNSSDPRGGDTVLTVLGGMTIDSPPGLTALLLPPLQPPAPPDAGTPKPAGAAPVLHPQTRAAMVQSLIVKDVYTYTTVGPVQDFHLFPRSTPHFSGHYDPSAILIVSDSDVPEARTSEAFEFPPPTFYGTPDSPTTHRQPATAPGEGGVDPEEALADELAITLQSMEVSDEPRTASLPPQLWDVLGEYLLKVDKHAYDTMVRDKLAPLDGEVLLPVKGGVAWSEDSEGQMKYIKYQPHRILATYLRDLSVRFLDVSPQLLVSTGEDNPLVNSFPSVLPRLRVDLAPLFIDHSLGLSLLPPTSAEYDPRLSKERIESVHIAPESLECVTVMRSGAVVLHRLDVQHEEGTFGQRSLDDEELVSLLHMRPRRGLRYSPVFAVKPHKARGLVTACALADAGFLAIAYASGSLLVIDLRGPRVILRHDPSRRNSSGFLHKHADVEPFLSLSWACCGLTSEPMPQLRLFASALSGNTSVYTLAHEASSAWSVKQAALAVEIPGRPIAGGCFVLEAKTGTRCRADRQGLATVLHPDSAGEGKKYVWVAVGSKGVRCTLNVNGERIAKADWGSKVGTVQRAEIVEKTDSCALVAFTSLGNALVYSLPHLEHINTIQLPASGTSDPPSTDDTGDFVKYSTFPAPAGSSVRPLHSTHLQTLFSHRRAGPYALPLVDLTHGRGSVPSQPQPISLGPPSMIGSMLGYIGSLSGASAGDQIDTLRVERPGASTSAAGSAPSQVSISATAAGMSSGVADLYNRLGSALAERGEMLGDLQQSMDSLEQGSKGMVEQAKRLAAQQGMKSWFGF